MTGEWQVVIPVDGEPAGACQYCGCWQLLNPDGTLAPHTRAWFHAQLADKPVGAECPGSNGPVWEYR